MSGAGESAVVARGLGERLAAVAGRLTYLSKDKRNDHHKYSYVSEAKVKAEMRAAFAAEGLVLYGVRASALHGSTPTAAVVEVILEVGMADDPRGFRSEFAGVGGDHDKSGKAVMKAMAAAIKYALTTGFLVPTGDDPEANREADELGQGGPAAASRKGGGRRRASAQAARTQADAGGAENPHAPTDEDW